MRFYYLPFKRRQLAGGPDRVDLLKDEIHVVLVTGAYKFDQKHKFLSDVRGEVEGKGYEPGGKVLISKAMKEVVDNQSGVGVFDADDLLWENSSIRAHGLILCKWTGDRTTSPLIAFEDMDEEIVSTNGPFKIRWNDAGICDMR